MLDSLYHTNIFIVDNNSTVAQFIVAVLPKKIKVNCHFLKDGNNIFYDLEEDPDLFIINRDLKQIKIASIVKFIKTKYPRAKIIVYCDQNCTDSVKELFEIGIDDYIALDDQFSKHIKLSVEYLILESRKLTVLFSNGLQTIKRLAFSVMFI